MSATLFRLLILTLRRWVDLQAGRRWLLCESQGRSADWEEEA